MTPRNTSQITSNEADVQLAISSVKSRRLKSNCKAAAVYNVSDRTLRRRRDCPPKTKKLTEPEEEVIVGHILDLNQRGFAPTYTVIRDMADELQDLSLSSLTLSCQSLMYSYVRLHHRLRRPLFGKPGHTATCASLKLNQR
jgi:hypothetical protein